MKFRFPPLASALLLACMNPAAAAGDARDLAKRAIRAWDLQDEMPGDAIKPPSQSWFDFHLSPDMARVLLWGTVILGAMIVAWSLRDSLPMFSRSRRIVAEDEISNPTGQSSRMDEAQLEADDLARQGYYGEAMHVLLLKSLHEIRRHLGISFAVSLTSREILRRVQLPEMGRQALADIIREVELTYFGGQQAVREKYADCRNKFDVLKHSLATVVSA